MSSFVRNDRIFRCASQHVNGHVPKDNAKTRGVTRAAAWSLVILRMITRHATRYALRMPWHVAIKQTTVRQLASLSQNTSRYKTSLCITCYTK